MATPIRGTEGTIKIGPTTGLTTVGFATEWSAEMTRDVTVKGPYFGDANKYKSTGGKDCTGSISADLVNNNNTGHTALITAFSDDTQPRLELTDTEGYQLIIPVAIISGVNVNRTAAEGGTIEFNFEANGGFTYLATP
jgi:hypothetical protein